MPARRYGRGVQKGGAAAIGLRGALAVTCLAALVLAAPAGAAFPGANGKIAFVHYPGGQIYTMNPDGTGPTPLTSGPAVNLEPAWSPDGTKIAFVSHRDEPNPTTCSPCNTEIYAMDADGGNQTRLTSDPAGDVSPAWSPDGTKIAFESRRTGAGDIYSMNADGTGVARLTTSSDFEDSPAWSPDGTKIAFTAGATLLRLMNPNGTNQTTIADSGTTELYAPDWSADATKIAYQEHSCCDSTDNTMEVHTIHRDGTADRGSRPQIRIAGSSAARSSVPTRTSSR
jgi:Tol biopolymer transport system component